MVDQSSKVISERPQMCNEEGSVIDSGTVEVLGIGDTAAEISGSNIAPVFMPHILPGEPDSGEVRVLLAVHLPSGQRQQRHFRPVEKLSAILQFAENICECDLSRYSLVCSLPKQVFHNLALKIEDTGLQNRTVLYLEENH